MCRTIQKKSLGNIGRALVWTLVLSGCSSAIADSSVGGLQDEAILHSETVYDQGLLFLEGRFIERPYKVEATKDAVLINGIEVSFISSNDGRGRGRGDRQGPGGGWQGQGRPEPGGRRRFQDRNHGPNRGQEPASVRESRLIASLLHNDTITVCFAGYPTRGVAFPEEKYKFYEAMISDRSSEDLDKFSELAADYSATSVWRSWLSDYSVPESLKPIIDARLAEMRAIEARNMKEVNATQRLNRFSYPLTILAMMLGVVSFGQMMQWTGRGFSAGSEDSGESIHYTVVCLWLILGMSLTDLAWTILAWQAGVMQEVNPLAASVIHSPLQLAIFKTIATGSALAILFAFRQRRQIQQATWWCCLVCVLLTFRWVLFDSMMLTA